MHWYYIIPLSIAAFTTIIVAAVAMRRSPAPGTIPFVVFCFAVAGWCVGYALEVSAKHLTDALFWLNFQLVCTALIPAAWMELTMEYRERKRVNPRFTLALLAIEPVFITTLVYTNSYHHLVIREATQHLEGTAFLISLEFGPAAMFHAIYSYMVMLFGTVLLVYQFAHTVRIFRRQIIVLLISSLFPWVGNLLFISGFAPLARVDLTPILFAVIAPLMAWSFFRSHLLDVTPIALDAVVESLEDGVIVIDNQNRVVHLNPAAEQLTGWRSAKMAGTRADRERPTLPALARVLSAAVQGKSGSEEIVLTLPGENRLFELRISDLHSAAGKTAGRLAVFRDITEHRKAEQALRRRAEELAALNATLLQISAVEDLPVLLHTIVERAVNLLKAHGGTLFLADPARQRVQCVVGIHTPPDLVGRSYAFGEGIAGKVAESGQSIYIPNYAEWQGRVEYTGGTPIPYVALIVAPLLWQGMVTGVITVAHDRPGSTFNKSDLELLTLFANQAAIAAERARLFEAERRQREQAETLREVALALSASLDRDQLLGAILEQLARVVSYDSTSLMLLHGDKIEIVSQRGFRSDAQRFADLSINNFKHMQDVVTARSVVIISDTRLDPRWIDVPDITYIRNWMGAPLIFQDQVIGLLNVDKEQPNFYTEQDAALALAFASQAAVAIKNARMYTEARRSLQEAETLGQATSAVVGTLDTTEAIARILEQLQYVLPYDSASVQLLRAGYLEVVGGRGWDDLSKVIGMRFPIPGNNPNTIVIEKGEPYIVNDTRNTAQPFLDLDLANIRAWMGVPLQVADRVIGMLSVDSQKTGSFTPDHARLAAAFAGQVAVAMENARLYAESEERANTLSLLYAAAQELATSLEPRVVLDQLARHLTQALGAAGGYILEVDHDHRLLRVLAEYWSRDGSSALTEESESHYGLIYWLGEYETAQRAYESGEAVSQVADPQRLPDSGRQILVEHNLSASLIVPVVSAGKLLGMAEIWETCAREFTPSEKRLAKALAQHAAGVIENARLYTAERKRVSELDALRATLADISAELELSRLLAAILERAVALLDSTGGDLGIYDARSQEVVIVASHNMGIDYSGIRMILGEGAMGRAALNMNPVLVNDYLAWEGRSAQYQGGHWHAVIAVPLKFAGKLVGVIGIVDNNPDRQFNRSDTHLLSMFAQQAAIAIQNARLYQSTKEAADRRAILHRLSQDIIAANMDMESIYTAIHQAASQIMPTEAFTIVLVKDEKQEMEAVYLVDRFGRSQGVTVPINEGLSGHVARTGKAIYIEDVDAFKEFDTVRFGGPEDVHSLLAVPMNLGNKVVGVLSAQSYEHHAYTSEDQNLLEMLAAYAAIALENARLFQEVQHLAVTDPLTGVNNRRNLFDLGQREFTRASRYERPLSAVMIDLDFFKRINDAYGHTAGDQVLIGLTHRLRGQIRDIDILGRYGGDEFVLLLPETDLDHARKVAERLRISVESTPHETDSGSITVTASLGVAVYTDETHSLEGLIDRADTAAYLAKQQGRNQVEG